MISMNTTLREIVPMGKRSGTHCHVYAEYRGCRYYLGSASTIVEAKDIVREYDDPAYVAYIRQQCDSTGIQGTSSELKRALTKRGN